MCCKAVETKIQTFKFLTVKKRCAQLRSSAVFAQTGKQNRITKYNSQREIELIYDAQVQERMYMYENICIAQIISLHG